MFLPRPPTLLTTITSILLLTPPTTPYKPLSPSFLRAIPSPAHTLDAHNSTLLSPLLIPRVPGTPGQTTAQNHLSTFFRTHLPTWTLTWQNSTSTTPLSAGAQVPFANLIARREPPWVSEGQANYLTLAAHYDSKFFAADEGTFVGATDSAAPCAMLLHIARVLEPHLARMYEEMSALGEGGEVDMDMGVQMLFLEGEEAWGEWSGEDSLYGSRALATHWQSHPNPLPQTSKFYKNQTPLSQISLFLLLDLLGSANPTVPSYYPTTHWAYLHLSRLETRLRSLNLLESNPPTPFLPDVNMTMGTNGVEDDHLPFLQRGVEVLHVIPNPFPEVWHTVRDDGGHLDGRTVRDWARILGAFALEWLDMMEVWDEPE
ncbi:glutaminyl-peptide cyclotransferase precursor [Pyrenophora tritici-repentis]|nr:glutaminyl-peptide cyclotransferase precursor [Pyrenophora tritici-repentis]